MKLKIIYDQAKALDYAYRMNLKNGARTIKLRRVIEKLNAEVKRIDDYRTQLIKDTGKNRILPTEPEFLVFVKKMNEALEDDVDVEVLPLIEEADFEPSVNPATGEEKNVEVSVEVLDGLYALGLMKTEEAATPAGATPVEPAKNEKQIKALKK